jgi:REP element-mobilizing transposase RayT
MSQSLAKIWSHLIFSTKERYPFLSDRHVRDELHAYMASILRNHDCPTLQIGGVADHIHALFVLSKNSSIAQIAYEVKRGSSKWIKTQGSEFRKFHWQSGYGAFSVRPSHVEQVRRYILRQEQHHRKITFEDEYLQFLLRYHVEYDERYIWD